jgi:hypothetical protein
MGKTLGRKEKFWVSFLLGTFIYIPFFVFSIMIQFPLAAILNTGGFLFYCYGLYRWIYTKVEPNYPLVPPEGRMTDPYFPRTKIPRPIHEDVRQYPEFFGKKKKKKYKRIRQVKKKT